MALFYLEILPNVKRRNGNPGHVSEGERKMGKHPKKKMNDQLVTSVNCGFRKKKKTERPCLTDRLSSFATLRCSVKQLI